MLLSTPIEIHEKLEDFPGIFYDEVMVECWKEDPSMRPPFTDIKELVEPYTFGLGQS